LKVIKLAISFLVKIITARRLERWRAVKKNRFGAEIKLETSARCPLDETGRNSVAACIIARRISVSMNEQDKIDI
jgi:hypothetical protein